MDTIFNKAIRLCITAFVSIILVGCSTTTDQRTDPPASYQRIDNFPMYGQPKIQRSEELKRADEDFIKKASEGLGGREKASQMFSSQGQRYLNEGNLDFAMRRFNQSWLLNPNNHQPYWGFGQVVSHLDGSAVTVQFLENSLQLDQLDAVLQYFNKALELINVPSEKPRLLSDLANVYAMKATSLPMDKAQEKNQLFLLSNKHFAESTKLDPSNGDIWKVWAMSTYSQGNFSDTWKRVKQARIHNAKPFPPEFLRDLEQKMPEPK